MDTMERPSSEKMLEKNPGRGSSGPIKKRWDSLRSFGLRSRNRQDVRYAGSCKRTEKQQVDVKG